MFFVVALLGASLLSANTLKNEEFASFDTPFDLKITAAYPIYYTTSCGVAAVTYNNGMSAEAMLEWADRLEENYCSADAPYSNTSGMY
ncbi:hypothetical protein [Riemerella anatipestifer]|nr:hypothetical protein [Riemerella anatipestifer]MBT0551126.1 hypothetical protein [Riemerella anatipestifer]MBT0553741.1 hypothetical protein [Riemerella anatipestifer]MCE3023916.1 hypothetical protein [Riemerella anatipestifer]MCU7559689.1 hypothetical protein [Riemerella anatipestifer]MDY3449140.1 hypothetical protein [Riemerella anatipestifer]